MKRQIKALKRLLRAATKEPKAFAHIVANDDIRAAAVAYARDYTEPAVRAHNLQEPPANPLSEYFRGHTEGNGIWKWEHYFDIYHRHFQKFVGREVKVLEIGIYSGGSLAMWQTYFGKQCRIYGVDVEDACRAYESENVSVLIGDQEDRRFWRQFQEDVGEVDIVIDDGGHTHGQQQVTLEEMLPFVRNGGVYLCEDTHGVHNGFAAFATSLVNELNQFKLATGPALQSDVSQFQQSIHSIHFYPYTVVIEKHDARPSQLSCPKQGTVWQPFL